MSLDNSDLNSIPDSVNEEKFTIEVVYGVPHKQKILTILVTIGSTVEQAIIDSGIIILFSGRRLLG